ncbi:Hypothetical predicted protein [Mytilus galloprovincialis]|uniref:Mutator-like transposase domain-containing protein n=1 Tax=Mytilus galloprovincialis TaxID=29158 RepID=A0A8B6BP58_MYTGA|nr:Hypothetical predicted protein [Mytilus galloprovincialis]
MLKRSCDCCAIGVRRSQMTRDFTKFHVVELHRCVVGSCLPGLKDVLGVDVLPVIVSLRKFGFNEEFNSISTSRLWIPILQFKKKSFEVTVLTSDQNNSKTTEYKTSLKTPWNAKQTVSGENTAYVENQDKISGINDVQSKFDFEALICYVVIGGFISWDLSAEQQRGAAWREKASCNECSYHSKMFNLYNGVIAKKRGRRTAAINLSIQVALNHIAISTTGLQKLFLGSNIPAPSTSSMQHSANVVSEIIEEYNQKDLVQKRKLIKEINILRGDNPNIINIQADGMYNNPIYSGMGKTPFQPATQCTYNMLENNTL